MDTQPERSRTQRPHKESKKELYNSCVCIPYFGFVTHKLKRILEKKNMQVGYNTQENQKCLVITQRPTFKIAKRKDLRAVVPMWKILHMINGTQHLKQGAGTSERRRVEPSREIYSCIISQQEEWTTQH